MRRSSHFCWRACANVCETEITESEACDLGDCFCFAISTTTRSCQTVFPKKMRKYWCLSSHKFYATENRYIFTKTRNSVNNFTLIRRTMAYALCLRSIIDHETLAVHAKTKNGVKCIKLEMHLKLIGIQWNLFLKFAARKQTSRFPTSGQPNVKGIWLCEYDDSKSQ